MKGYKGNDFADRIGRATAAREAALEHFKARPSADDPAVLERAAARREIVKAREARAAERKAAQLALEAQKAAEEAERLAAQKLEAEAEAERQRELERLQKEARDARYAARKARKR
jgi:Family of unknown function (DUF6481)